MNAQVMERDLTLSINNDICEIKSTIVQMVDFTKNLEITTQDSFKIATKLWKQVKDWKKTIDQQRKDATEPYRKHVTAINDKAKEMTDPLTEIEDLIKHKTELYQKLLEKQRDDEVSRRKEAAEMIGISQFSIYVPQLDKAMRGDGAVAYAKIEKRFLVKDISQVPTKYLVVDEKAIERDIKLGVSEIPGIEIYEEKSVQLRSR